jgi:hypothetical protein
VNAFRRHRSNASLIIACLALFVALGGVGYAAATIGSAQIKNNSVKSKDIKNRSIAGKDVKRNALGGSQVKESSLGKVRTAGQADSATNATNAQNAQNAETVGGQTAGTLAEPRAYGYVVSNGTNASLDAARTKGVQGVTRFSAGTYCLDTSFDVKQVVATVEYSGGSSNTIVHASANNVGGVCAGFDAIVRTTTPAGAGLDGPEIFFQLH